MPQVDSRVSPSDDNVTVLSRNTEIRGGTLRVAHDLTVRGIIEGEVRVGGKVVVATGAQVDGLLHAREAIVAGRVRGELLVTETLTLRSTAAVDGTATAARLVVEEGSTGSVAVKVGGKEFFDLLETRRQEARAELDRVRSRVQRSGDRSTGQSPVASGIARTVSSTVSTERLIDSNEMREFISVEPPEKASSDEAVRDAARAPDELG